MVGPRKHGTQRVSAHMYQRSLRLKPKDGKARERGWGDYGRLETRRQRRA